MGADIVEYVDQKFRSGNSVPIDRAWLSADEWAQLRAEIGRLRGEVSEMAEVLGEAYQVVGLLLSDTDQFDTPHGDKVLDNLSQMKMVHDDVLPWASVEKPAPAMPNGVEGLEDLVTHREAWRNALVFAKGRMAGTDDESYWQHEITAFDRTFAALRAADNRDAAGVDDATFAEWLATEMPAGTVIGNPEWWANRIARQYRVRNTPAAVPAGEAVALIEWKNAVLNELAGTGMDAEQDEPPYSILQRIINWHTEVSYETGLDVADIFPIPKEMFALAAELREKAEQNEAAHSPAAEAPAPVQAAPQEGEWPDYVMLRDTKLHDDAGGLGQRIFTTAGAGYTKVKYVRADLAAHPSACELGAVRERFADILQAEFDLEVSDPEDYRFDDGRKVALRIADLLVAALQHRGDSRGGEG